MNIIGICILAVVSAILALSLKQNVPHFAMLLTLAVGIIIFISVCTVMPDIITKIDNLMSATGVNTEYTAILLKTVGICFLCQFSVDICRDSGQGALAGKVEFAGKLMILLSALPLMNEIIDTASSLLGA